MANENIRGLFAPPLPGIGLRIMIFRNARICGNMHTLTTHISSVPALLCLIENDAFAITIIITVCLTVTIMGVASGDGEGEHASPNRFKILGRRPLENSIL